MKTYSKILGDEWDMANFCWKPRPIKETRKIYKSAINYHTGICLVCGKKLSKRADGEYKGEYTSTSIHHINRVPPIVAILHKACHIKIDSDHSSKYDFLKPQLTRYDINLVREGIEQVQKKQLKNFNGSNWVRFR